MKLAFYSSATSPQFDGPWDVGARRVTLPTGRTVSRLTVPIPEWGVYDALVTGSLPNYHTEIESAYVFHGNEGDVLAHVEIVRQFAQISIDELLTQKVREADSHLDSVMGSNFRSTDRLNWVGLLTPGQKEWLSIVNGALQDRLERGVAYFPRNVPVAGLNTANGNREVIALDRGQWTSYWDDLGKHGFDAVDAWGLVVNDAEAQHAAGNWSQLAAIDVAAPEYGWPETWNGAAFV